MEIELTTPALLFPTVSLLLLAYTSRFVALATVVRQLHASHAAAPSPVYVEQIASLRRRIRLIRDMQFAGVLSLLLCTVCMTFLFFGWELAGRITFGASLVCMAVSLVLSLVEIGISVHALDVHLRDIDRSGP